MAQVSVVWWWGRECAQRSQPLPRGLPPTEVGLRTPGSYTVSL